MRNDCKYTDITVASCLICSEHESCFADKRLHMKKIPFEISNDGSLFVRVPKGENVTRVIVLGDDHYGDVFYPDSDEE